MALVTTPGSASANSYASVAEANAYNASRPFSTGWTGSDAVKEAALTEAARLLDAAFRWTGMAVDDVQALTWPRSGMLSRNGFAIPTSGTSSIPQALKDAQSEFARQLLEANRTADDDAQKAGIEKVKAGSVEVTFKKMSGGQSDPFAYLDAEAARMGNAFDYLSRVIPDAVRMLLVPSWYAEAFVTRSEFLLEVDR